MPVNRHFDLLAAFYDRVIRPPDAERLARLLNLPAGGWMLDAGGGTGRVASALCDMVDRLVISDLSQPMLRQTALKSPGPEGALIPTQARVERLPFADGTFNRILVVDAFHHFGDQTRAAEELARVLRPGGRLVIEEPDIRHFSVKVIALAETLALMGSRFRSPAAIREMLEEEGLDARIETEGTTAWVIAEKKLIGGWS